jgi:hypothetical protein
MHSVKPAMHDKTVGVPSSLKMTEHREMSVVKTVTKTAAEMGPGDQ